MTQKGKPSSTSDRGNRVNEGKLIAAAGLVVLTLSGAVGWFSPRFFKLDLFQLLYANVIGVLGGGYLALWGNRVVSRQQERDRRQHEADQRRHRANQALAALKETVKHNKEEVDSVVRSLNLHPAEPVFSKADPRAFDPVLSRVVQMVEDLDLIRRATTLRHELEEFNRMAEAQLELFLLPEAHPNVFSRPGDEVQKVRKLREKLLKKTKRYGKRISKNAEELHDELEKAGTGQAGGS